MACLLSHFFPLGDRRRLVDFYNRPTDTIRQIWLVPTAGQREYKRVYELTSARTFSGGDDCAYDFQVQKRRALVGETTGGGSNPVSWFSVGHGTAVVIQTSCATNFVSKINWEHIGVKPDIAAPACDGVESGSREAGLHAQGGGLALAVSGISSAYPSI